MTSRRGSVLGGLEDVTRTGGDDLDVVERPIGSRGTEFALDGAEGDGASVVQMKIADGFTFDKREVRRSQIVQAVMSVRGNQLGVVSGDRAIYDLNRVVRSSADGDALTREDVCDLASVVRKFDADTGHLWDRRSGIDIAAVMPGVRLSYCMIRCSNGFCAGTPALRRVCAALPMHKSALRAVPRGGRARPSGRAEKGARR